MDNKLGSYISKLMVTIIESEDEFVKGLALSELKKINTDVEEFLRKHSKDDVEESKETIKTLLQEEKEDVKNK